MPRKPKTQSTPEGFELPVGPVGAEQTAPPAPAVTLDDATASEEVETTTEQTAPPAPVKVEEFPSDLKKCLALLSGLEALPERTSEEEAFKRLKLTPLKAHIARLQNGPPPPAITANEYHAAGHAGTANVQATRLELAARGNPDIRDLLKENAALKAQVTQVTQG